MQNNGTFWFIDSFHFQDLLNVVWYVFADVGLSKFALARKHHSQLLSIMKGCRPKMTYSIIIPIYNAEKTLRRCVDSLLKQD